MVFGRARSAARRWPHHSIGIHQAPIRWVGWPRRDARVNMTSGDASGRIAFRTPSLVFAGFSDAFFQKNSRPSGRVVGRNGAGRLRTGREVRRGAARPPRPPSPPASGGVKERRARPGGRLDRHAPPCGSQQLERGTPSRHRVLRRYEVSRVHECTLRVCL